MLTQQFMRGVKDEKVTQRLAPMRPRDMTFRELQVELRQMERESRMAAALKMGAKMHSHQSQQARPPHEYQQSPSSLPDLTAYERSQPVHKNSQPKTDHEVLHELVLTVRQLAQKFEQISTTPRQAQHPMRNQHSDGPRVFVCHKCGQEGHIAKGCRRAPLNSKGPRPEGKPSEAPNSQAH